MLIEGNTVRDCGGSGFVSTGARAVTWKDNQARRCGGHGRSATSRSSRSPSTCSSTGRSAIAASGAWEGGFGPSELLDATTHVGMGIQGENSDTVSRRLDVDRITVMDGICPPGTVLVLP